MDDFVGKKLEKLCTTCKQGYLHQYPQDPQGTHRCGRCGEIEIKAAKPATTRKGQ